MTDPENEIIIRGKWMMDGAKTLDEAADMLKGEAAYLLQLKADGWELTDRIDDDYGFVRK